MAEPKKTETADSSPARGKRISDEQIRAWLGSKDSKLQLKGAAFAVLHATKFDRAYVEEFAKLNSRSVVEMVRKWGITADNPCIAFLLYLSKTRKSILDLFLDSGRWNTIVDLLADEYLSADELAFKTDTLHQPTILLHKEFYTSFNDRERKRLVEIWNWCTSDEPKKQITYDPIKLLFVDSGVSKVRSLSSWKLTPDDIEGVAHKADLTKSLNKMKLRNLLIYHCDDLSNFLRWAKEEERDNFKGGYAYDRNELVSWLTDLQEASMVTGSSARIGDVNDVDESLRLLGRKTPQASASKKDDKRYEEDGGDEPEEKKDEKAEAQRQKEKARSGYSNVSRETVLRISSKYGKDLDVVVDKLARKRMNGGALEDELARIRAALLDRVKTRRRGR